MDIFGWGIKCEGLKFIDQSIWKYLDDDSLTTERHANCYARWCVIEFIFRWHYLRKVNDCNHFDEFEWYGTILHTRQAYTLLFDHRVFRYDYRVMKSWGSSRHKHTRDRICQCVVLISIRELFQRFTPTITYYSRQRSVFSTQMKFRLQLVARIFLKGLSEHKIEPEISSIYRVVSEKLSHLEANPGARREADKLSSSFRPPLNKL